MLGECDGEFPCAWVVVGELSDTEAPWPVLCEEPDESGPGAACVVAGTEGVGVKWCE